jgi:hypothetical protein
MSGTAENEICVKYVMLIDDHIWKFHRLAPIMESLNSQAAANSYRYTLKFDGPEALKDKHNILFGLNSARRANTIYLIDMDLTGLAGSTAEQNRNFAAELCSLARTPEILGNDVLSFQTIRKELELDLARDHEDSLDKYAVALLMICLCISLRVPCMLLTHAASLGLARTLTRFIHRHLDLRGIDPDRLSTAGINSIAGIKGKDDLYDQGEAERMALTIRTLTIRDPLERLEAATRDWFRDHDGAVPHAFEIRMDPREANFKSRLFDYRRVIRSAMPALHSSLFGEWQGIPKFALEAALRLHADLKSLVGTAACSTAGSIGRPMTLGGAFLLFAYAVGEHMGNTIANELIYNTLAEQHADDIWKKGLGCFCDNPFLSPQEWDGARSTREILFRIFEEIIAPREDKHTATPSVSVAPNGRAFRVRLGWITTGGSVREFARKYAEHTIAYTREGTGSYVQPANLRTHYGSLQQLLSGAADGVGPIGYVSFFDNGQPIMEVGLCQRTSWS